MRKKSSVNVLQAIRNLDIGRKLVFPVERSPYVKSVVSNFSIVWDRSFSTHVSRESRTIEVTRLS